MTVLPLDADQPLSTRSHVRERLLERAPWLAALVTLVLLVTTDGGAASVGVFYDDGIYLDLARALISGEGYRHLALPGAPEGVHYPPLFPAWLALWSWARSLAGPHDVVAWLKLGNVLLTALAVAGWATWGVRRLALHPVLAGGVVAASLLIVPARAVTSVLFSEPLSWVLLAAALLAVPDERDSRARGVLGAVIVALLPMARTILLPFTLAGAWHSARRGDGRWRLPLAALCLAPMAGWSLWTMLHAPGIPGGWQANYGSYTGMWLASWSSPADLADLALRQLAGFARIAGAIWSVPGAVIAVPCVVAGCLRLWTVQRWALAGLAGYVALVLVWPIEPDRFVWGVLPLVASLGAAGAVDVVTRLRHRRLLAAAALVLVALPVGACARWTVAGYRNRGWAVPQEIAERNAAPLVRWGRTLPSNAIVVTGNDPLFAMATGRRAVPALPPDLGEARGRPLTTPAQRLEWSACELGEGWLAIGDSEDQVGVALRQLLRSTSSRLAVTKRLQLEGRAEAWRFRCNRG